MNYENSKNENEILSADERKVSEMCRSLKRVEAPKDFEFKLKTRIADADPRAFQPRYTLAFRYALPALALILVLGLLAYNGGFWSSSNNMNVAENQFAPQSQLPPPNSDGSILPTPVQTPDENTAVVSPVQETAKRNEKTLTIGNSTTKTARENKKDSFVGSKDFSSTEAKPKQPEFIQLTNTNRQPAFEKSNPIPVKDVFSQIGIEANLENGKWKVKSVRANSLGDSSEVKANDVIEAIDDQPVTSETVFNKTAGGKSLTVTRNGEKIQIKLRNKQ